MSTGKTTANWTTDSEVRAQALADASFEAVIFSENGLLVDQNLTAEKMFGYSLEEALGCTVTRLVIPEDRERVKSNVLSGYEEPYEATALRKDGSTFPCKIQGRMFDCQGRRLRVAALRDISAYKRTQQLLNETGRMARIGGWEHDMVSGKATWTDALFEVLEIAPNEIPGVEEHLNYYPPKDRAILKEAYYRAVEEGIPFDLVLQGHTGAGRLRWWRVYGERVIENGKCIKMRGTLQDITERREAEEALQESEERFESFLEDLGDIAYGTDCEGNLTYTNKAGELATGLKREELIGRPFLPLFTESCRAETVAAYTRSLQGETAEMELTFLNGRIFSFKSEPKYSSDGKIVGVFGIARDVTAARLAEAQLKASRAHLETLVNTLPDLVWLKDSDGVFLTCNRRFESLYGATRSEIVGKTDYDFVDKDLADFFRAHDRAAAAAGKPTMNEEDLSFASDGHHEWLETIKTPMYDSDGKLIGVLGIGRDITERRQAEEKLCASEAKYRSYVDNAPHGIFVADSAGNYIEVNEAAVRETGYTEEELLTLNILDLVPPESRSAAEDHFRSVVRNGHFSEEAQFQRKDGRRGFWQVSAVALGDGRYLGFTSDITELKKTQAGLQESEEKYRTLFENMMNSFALHEIVLDDAGTPIDYIFLEVNSAFERMTGLKRDDIVGKRVTEVIPGIEKDPANWIGRYGEVAVTGEAETFEQHSAALARSYSVLAFCPTKGRFATVFDDITDRRQAVAALAESEDRFRHMVESMSDWVWEVDANGIYTFVSENVESVLGYTADELLGRSPFELMPPEEADRVGKLFMKIAQNRESIRDLENWNLCKDGRQVCLLTSGVPLLDDEGDLIGYRGVDRDITGRKRAEEALRESEERLMRALENIPDVVVIYDHDLRIRYINEATRKLTGRPAAYFRGKRDDEIWPTEMCEPYLPALREARDTGQTCSVEVNVAIPDIGLRSLSITCVPLIDESGKAREILGITHDFTERQEYEEALRESEEKFRDLADSLPQIVFETDLEGRLTYVNELAFEKMGYTRADFESGLLALDVVAPECREEAGESMRQILAGNETGGHEYVAIRKDGTRFPIFIHSRQKLVEDKSVGLRGIVFDITERKRAEEAIRESEAKLSNAMKIAKLGHWEYDVAENMFTFNDGFYAIFRTTAEAEGGYKMSPERYVERFLHPDDAGTVAREMSLAMETDDPKFSRQIEHRIVYADGEVGHIAVRFNVVKDSAGNTIKTYGANQDITERVQMQRELAKADKLESVGLLAGGIAHDFNNILTAIMGNISLAKLEVEENSEVEHCLDEAENASARAVQLTAQLLTFAKGGAPILEATSIGEIIRETAGFSLRGSNVKCVYELPKNLAMVNADTGQLSQVINNLLINADQAMPEGGTIKISAENVTLTSANTLSLDGGAYVRVIVADQGVGISPKHLGKVFDPFFTTKQKGNGLGLASVYSIIKKHQGHIAVASEVGEGTTFTIHLPAIQSEKRVAVRGGKDELMSGSGKVLVVDDEDSVRRLAGAILTRLGYEVEVATEGGEGIRLYQEALSLGEPYAAVILDLTIPGGLGGRETIERLREIDPEVRAIVSSGYSTDQVMADFRDYGFCGRISKPFGVQEFSKVMQEVMNCTREPV
ncbi:MAG: PAS domain S-box protein [bacterium]